MKVADLVHKADPSGSGSVVTGARGNVQTGVFRDNDMFEAGRMISKFGDTLGDYADKKLREDGAVLYAKKMGEFRDQMAQVSDYADQNHKVDDTDGKFNVNIPNAKEDGSASTYTGYFESEYDKRSTALLSGITNPYARKQLEESLGTYRGQVTAAALREEGVLRRNARLESLNQVMERSANQVRTNPIILDQAMNELEASIRGAGIGGLDEQKTIDAAKGRLGLSAAIGMAEKDPAGTKALLSDPNNKFKDWLSPAGMEHVLNEIDRQMKLKAADLKSDVSLLAGDHMAAILETGSGLPGLTDKAKLAYADDPTRLQHFLAQESAMRSGYNAKQRLHDAPVGELANIAAAAMPTKAGPAFQERLRVAKSLEAEAHEQIRLFHMDPKAAVDSMYGENLAKISDPRQRLSKELELQRMKGVQFPRVLTKAETAAAINTITGSSPEQAINVIQQTVGNFDGIGVQYGGEVMNARDLAFRELVSAENGLPPMYASLVSAVEDGEMRLAHDLATALSRKKDKGLTSLLNDPKEDLKTIDKELLTQLSDWRKNAGYGQPERGRAIDAVMDSARELALSYTFDGLSPEKAAARAAKTLVLDRYVSVDSPLQIPRSLPGVKGVPDADAIKAGLELRRWELQDSGMAADALSYTLKGKPRYANEDLDKLVGQRAIEAGKWVNNENNTGAYFYIPLLDGSHIRLEGKDGPVVVPFTEAQRRGVSNDYEDKTPRMRAYEERQLQQGPNMGEPRYMDAAGKVHPGNVVVDDHGHKRIVRK